MLLPVKRAVRESQPDGVGMPARERRHFINSEDVRG
jgi:hypothetical protein